MTEAQLHRAVAQFLRLALKPPTIWTTIGHGGGGRVRGAQLKAMGVQKGWPDILAMRPSMPIDPPDSSIVMAIELKAKKGRLSPEQEVMRDAFCDVGAVWRTCFTVEEVESQLRIFGFTLHATCGKLAA